MSYNKHTFTSGQTEFAAALNEMDSEIAFDSSAILSDIFNSIKNALDIEIAINYESGYYRLPSNTGEYVYRVDSENYKCYMFAVKPGDKVIVSGKGGSNTQRRYGILDSDKNLIYRLLVNNTTGFSVYEPFKNYPNAAYVVVNFDVRYTDEPTFACAGKITDDMIAEIGSIEAALDLSFHKYNYVIPVTFNANTYWHNNNDVAEMLDYASSYSASDPIEVQSYQKIKIYAYSMHSSNQETIFITDDNYNILYSNHGTRDAYNTFNIYVPNGGTKLLITTDQSKAFSATTPKYEIKNNNSIFEFADKNIAIIGDSISTNGNLTDNNPHGNVPEIRITEDDVGVELSAYVTWWDVFTNEEGTSFTNKTIGGISLTDDMIGTEITFTPTGDDVGKQIGVPNNANPAGMNVWWEILVERLGFNPIPVCWSGSSITSHESSSDLYAASYAWHESQIRKCGIRIPGHSSAAENRIAPDMVIIFRGTNDFSHTPYTRLTDYLDKYPFSIPETDVVVIDDNERYGYLEGLAKTIDAVRNAYPEAQIVVCTFNYFHRMSSSLPGFPSRNGVNTIYQYNDAIRALANYFGCGVIEFDKDGITYANAASGAYYREGTNPTANHTHPNDKGQAVMANRAYIDLCNVNQKN